MTPQKMTVEQFRSQPPRVGGRRVTPETAVKHAVKEYLSLRGWFVRHNLQGLGCYPGMPDMLATKDGRTVEIECKSPKGRQSSVQEEYQDALEARGGTYWIVRSLEELIESLGGCDDSPLL